LQEYRSYPSLLDSVSCATSYGAPSLHHSFSFTLFTNDPVEETNRIPGRAFVLFCSCECATNLLDSCWSVQPHYGHFKAELSKPAGTSSYKPSRLTCQCTVWQKWNEQPCTQVFG
ncbi:hypothetical protein T05_14950, partial [Trichinella murrelli]